MPRKHFLESWGETGLSFLGGGCVGLEMGGRGTRGDDSGVLGRKAVNT